MKVDNAALPEAVRVPPGQKLMMTTTGVGEITYECRESKDMAGEHEWSFELVGKYYAGPTWESVDGSRITGKQVAIASASPGSLPLQLVKAQPAIGAGAMTGASYVQRLNTQGGVAPATGCDATGKGKGKGKRQVVAYEADYVFYGM